MVITEIQAVEILMFVVFPLSLCWAFTPMLFRRVERWLFNRPWKAAIYVFGFFFLYIMVPLIVTSILKARGHWPPTEAPFITFK